MPRVVMIAKEDIFIPPECDPMVAHFMSGWMSGVLTGPGDQGDMIVHLVIPTSMAKLGPGFVLEDKKYGDLQVLKHSSLVPLSKLKNRDPFLPGINDQELKELRRIEKKPLYAPRRANLSLVTPVRTSV